MTRVGARTRWLCILLGAPLLLGAADPEDAPKPRVDENARPGDPLLYAAPPAPSPKPACSFRLPICVHSTGSSGLAVLAAAERAWATLTGALDLPTPDLDPATLTYPIHLVEGASLPETRLAARDVRSSFDRARAFTVFDAGVKPGCALDVAVARALARASLYRVAPATDEGTARAQTQALAELTTPCSLAYGADAKRAFQSEPHKTPADGSSLAFAEGASLFWSRVEWAYARRPGALIGATWALAPTRTPIGAATWKNEPDVWDILRITFKNALSTGSTLADLMLDVSVARAFMGGADDGLHAPETRTLGEAGGVPLDWDIPWPTAPRRLAARHPPAPGGASYLRIKTEGVKSNERLRVEIVWEEHALFRWAFVKIDPHGREIGRVVIPTRERATEAQMTLVDLSGAASVLLVGTNTGDPAYTFDPDDATWEPHGWLVTIAAE